MRHSAWRSPEPRGPGSFGSSCTLRITVGKPSASASLLSRCAPPTWEILSDFLTPLLGGVTRQSFCLLSPGSRVHPALGAPDSHFSCKLHGAPSTHTHWRIPRAPSAPGPHASTGQMCSSSHPKSRGKIAIEEHKTGDFSFSWDCPREKLPRRCGVRAEVGVFVLEKGQQLIGRSQCN